MWQLLPPLALCFSKVEPLKECFSLAMSKQGREEYKATWEMGFQEGIASAP